MKEIEASIKSLLTRFNALTDDDKACIKAMCKFAGLKVTLNKRCANCYQDALMLLKMHYNVESPKAEILTPSGNYVYYDGNKKVVWWHRHHYTELSAQSDDATIEQYMAQHPSQRHFSRVEPEPEPKDETENGGKGTESDEPGEGGVTEQVQPESGAEEQKIDNTEGDDGGKEGGDETNE